MGTKKTSKTTYNDTKTVAPPSWTMPGIQTAADQVIKALGTLPGDKYTGEFVATPDQYMVDTIMDKLMNVGGQSGSLGTDTLNKALGLPMLSAGDNTRSLFTPTAGPARPDLASLVPTLPGFAPVAQANILEMPNIAGMAPALPTAPTMVSWNPTGWSEGNGEARLKAAIDAGIAPVFRQLTEQILPGIRSSAIEAGAYSGDRAMSVLPTTAIAEASGRASEVAAGLANEGYQSEQNRSLQAWQALQSFLGQKQAQENQFGLGLFDAQTRAALQSYGINVDAMMQGYQTQQEALLRNAGMANDYNLGTGTQTQNGLLDIFKTLAAAETDMYGADQNFALGQGKLQNEAFGLNADWLLGMTESNQKQAMLRDQLINSGLALSAAEADMLIKAMGIGTSAEQAGIDNALAEYQYGIQYPFQGLDIAVPLLAQLSGNYGTTTSAGQQKTVEKTGGLGQVAQGLMGAASLAAGLGAFGPLGAASKAMGPASASSVFQMNKGQGFGMNGFQ